MSKVSSELQTIMERDPACKSKMEARALYPGYSALRSHKRAHWLYNKKMFFLARLVSHVSRRRTGIEIHPGAKIGNGVFIDHGCGVVIGETAEIGDNCILYQGVTLGGTGKDSGKRHPTLGNDVLVGAGAKILGPFRVGDHAKIAAGAVVLSEVPDYGTAVGIPARVVRIADTPVKNSELDQIHIPDPVSQELSRMESMITSLEMRIKELEG